jgi:hypothetical protein
MQCELLRSKEIMIRNAKDLSKDQKLAIESLLGRSVSDDDQVSVHVIPPGSVPDWLKESWGSASEAGLDRLSMEEIDAEIASARRQRH